MRDSLVHGQSSQGRISAPLRQWRAVVGAVSTLLSLGVLFAQTNSRPEVVWQLPGTFYPTPYRQELVTSPSGQKIALFNVHDPFGAANAYISIWNNTDDAQFTLITTMRTGVYCNINDIFSKYSGPRVAFLGEDYLVAADGSAAGNGVDYYSINPADPDGTRYSRLATYRETGVTHYAVAAINDDPTHFIAVGENNNNAVIRLYEYDPLNRTISLRDEEILGVGVATCVDCASNRGEIFAFVGTDSGRINMVQIQTSLLTLMVMPTVYTAPAQVTRIDAYSDRGSLKFVAGTLLGHVVNSQNIVYVEPSLAPVYDIDIVPNPGASSPAYCWVSFYRRAVHLSLDGLAFAGSMEYPAYQSWYERSCLGPTNAYAPLSFAMHPTQPSAFTLPIATVPSITRIALQNRVWETSAPLNGSGAYVIDSTVSQRSDGSIWRHFAVASGTTASSGNQSLSRRLTTFYVTDLNSLSYGTTGVDAAYTLKDIAYLRGDSDPRDTDLYVALQDAGVIMYKNEFHLSGGINLSGVTHAVAAVQLQGTDDRRRVAIGRANANPEVLLYDHVYSSTNWDLKSTITLPTGYTSLTVRDLAFNPANPNQLCVYATYRGSFGVTAAWVGLYDLTDPTAPTLTAQTTVNVPSLYAHANAIAYSPYGDKIAFPISASLYEPIVYLYSSTDLSPIAYSLVHSLDREWQPPYFNSVATTSVAFVDTNTLMVGMSASTDLIDLPAGGNIVGLVQLEDGSSRRAYWKRIQSSHTAPVTAVSVVEDNIAASVSDDDTIRFYNFTAGNGTLTFAYNPPNFNGTLDFERNTSEIAGGGHFILGRGVRNDTYPELKNLTQACAAHTEWISGSFDSSGLLWHVTPSAISVIDGTGAIKQTASWSTLNYQYPAAVPFVSIASEGNRAVLCVPSYGNDPANRLTFASYDVGTNTLTLTQPTLNVYDYYRSVGMPNQAVAMDPSAQYALFVGSRRQTCGTIYCFPALLALFNTTTGALITEKMFTTADVFYAGALLPRDSALPLVVVVRSNSSVAVYDPANSWSLVQTLPNTDALSVDYRDGYVVFGGYEKISVYAYDPNATNPLSSIRDYNLEAWPGIVNLKLGNHNTNDQKIPVVYSRANGDLTYAYLSTVRQGCGCPDINTDGIVDDADLLIVLFGFGLTGPNLYSQGDVNCDETVDDADLLEVLFAFGGPCP